MTLMLARSARANFASAPSTSTGFATRVTRWQAKHGRHDLPWQQTRDPYRIWLAEIMLQQTQVATVIPYYLRFVARFPDVRALAAARVAEVMALWSGLGYYARARNLHACARIVAAEHGGRCPVVSVALAQLPGIGRSTAAAIAAFCSDERAPILDGNVKRVLARHFGVGVDPRTALGERTFGTLARSLLPRQGKSMPAYTQGLMDLGAIVCVRRAPTCEACPLRRTCVAYGQHRIAELPMPPRPRLVPTRTAHWLILRRGDSVLLERRPARGLWGGLLAPPTYASQAELHRALQSTPWAPIERVLSLPVRRHAFTHFVLRFFPHIARIESAAEIPSGRRRLAAAPSGNTWLALERVETAALPAPVRTLLIELREGRVPT